MGIIAKPLGMLLNLIYGFVGNYGLAIIIFTVIVKLCLYPLYAKQISSTARMSEVQPKILALQNKYKDDKEMLNQKLSELYQKENYNPMSGCLPMIIQMPIIFALFALLRDPIYYMGDSEELLLAVHGTFLWIRDLSQPDLWILPILAGITTFISFSQTQAQQSGGSDAAAAASASSMKAMKYVFPILIVYMGRTFPAGLTIYWFFNTLVQLVFNFRFNRMKKKIKAKSEEAKKKGKKQEK